MKLQPGGFHIMLLGLKQGLTAGSRFPLTLTFEKAGSVQMDVPVEAMGSMGPGGQAGRATPVMPYSLTPTASTYDWRT